MLSLLSCMEASQGGVGAVATTPAVFLFEEFNWVLRGHDSFKVLAALFMAKGVLFPDLVLVNGRIVYYVNRTLALVNAADSLHLDDLFLLEGLLQPHDIGLATLLVELHGE